MNPVITLSKCDATNKTRFATPGAAKTAIIKIKAKTGSYESVSKKRIKRRKGKPEQCRYYMCKHCKGYHLTRREAAPKKVKILKEAKERTKSTKGLVIEQYEAAAWKADSLPFPEIKKTKQPMNWYNLNEDKTVTLLPKGEFTDYTNSRKIANDTVNNVMVSTVFLGLDHNWEPEGKPVLFETMIFGGEYDQEMWRYCTYQEAKESHDRIVNCFKENKNPIL